MVGARVAVVLNPAAGSWKRFLSAGSPEGRASLVQSWFGESEVEVRETRRPGDGAEQARLAIEDGFTTVVAVGGDGTIREVIQGLHSAGKGRLGIAPLGTANVLARALRIPVGDFSAAAEIAVGESERRIDLGKCGSSIFAMHAGIGLDGAVVRSTNPRLKRRLGRFAYILNTAGTALRSTRAMLRISIDGETFRSYDAYQVLVANIPEYGGNMRLGDNISPADGLLDVIICKSRGTVFVSALADGLALTSNRLTMRASIEYLQVRNVHIESSRSLDVQLDGDFFGNTPVEIQVLSSALLVAAPKVSR